MGCLIASIDGLRKILDEVYLIRDQRMSPELLSRMRVTMIEM